MRLPRPSYFLLLCLALLATQTTILSAYAPSLWAHASKAARIFLCISLLAVILHTGLLLAQLLLTFGQQARRDARLKAANQRIARDIHDRVGSRLVNALAMMNSDAPGGAEQRLALELVLVELRTVVDTLDTPHRPVREQLAQLRYRLQPIFEHQGISLEWDVNVHKLPDPQHEALLVLVAQEGLSNVLQHAKASKVCVLLNALEGAAGWYFEISDNGGGLKAVPDDAALHHGFGTISMRERLREAGAELAFEPSPLGGLCLRATLRQHP